MKVEGKEMGRSVRRWWVGAWEKAAVYREVKREGETRRMSGKEKVIYEGEGGKEMLCERIQKSLGERRKQVRGKRGVSYKERTG